VTNDEVARGRSSEGTNGRMDEGLRGGWRESSFRVFSRLLWVSRSVTGASLVHLVGLHVFLTDRQTILVHLAALLLQSDTDSDKIPGARDRGRLPPRSL
jgi:hypothetical protein